MSGLDKIIASLTPPESEEKRAEAHAKARSVAKPGDWLSMVLDQHEAIDQAFASVRAAAAPNRRTELRKLETLLTGHFLAEEIVIYPALAQVHEQGHANQAYTEQTAAKMQIAALEVCDPTSQDYLDKLGHLEGAVKHHVFEEESRWLLELQNKSTPDQAQRITARFKEEFGRYMGEERRGASVSPAEPRTFAGDQLGRDLNL